jgi:hypothetical protein
VRNHLQLKATGHLDYNKRGVDRLDDQREANRMDEFLAKRGTIPQNLIA